ncbi:zinc finger transcription factor lin-29-like [Schistocerca cancellata]|uniref:zinc finger transcription factor lin-29-like n=1 Tax=Schistocerca cancellata TaxID=274614 RepID=UPI002118BD9E|nr:zinc finger transcription factor lin-29-like [Schistocerca cancellata]
MDLNQNKIVSASWTVNAMPSQVTSTNHPTSGIPAMVPDFRRNKMLQGMKQYICSTCGKQYSIKASLQRHVRYECGVEPQFCCPYCSKRSHRKSNLSQHIRRILGISHKHNTSISPVKMSNNVSHEPCKAMEHSYLLTCYYCLQETHNISDPVVIKRSFSSNIADRFYIATPDIYTEDSSSLLLLINNFVNPQVGFGTFMILLLCDVLNKSNT